ncbi:hypothetical protein ACXYL9_03950 [Qipengyuania sp. CAU 1752]
MIRNITFAVFASALLLSAPNAWAQEKRSVHTLGSATDVWRIELRTLRAFLAMSAGDSDGVSELQKLEIRLAGTDSQSHAVTEVNPFFRVNGGPRTTRNVIDVGIGDRVNLDRLEPGRENTYDMWVHARQSNAPGAGGPRLVFQISVNARELDCVSDNICGRGNTGVVTYDISLPVPTTRSLRCIPENTYRISAVNGATMRLSPIVQGSDRSVETIAPRFSGSSTGAKIASGSGGPHLAMQSGEICISATRLLPNLPDVRPEAPRIPRDRKIPGR